MPVFEKRTITEERGLSRKYSAIAKTPVKVYVDWHPRSGKQFPLYWKGRFIMMLERDDGAHQKWVHEHFQKLRGMYYKDKVYRAEADKRDEALAREEERDQEDWKREVDDAADWAVDRPISFNIGQK